MMAKWLIEASLVALVGVAGASAADRGTSLLDAARAGDSQAVRALVNQKADVARFDRCRPSKIGSVVIGETLNTLKCDKLGRPTFPPVCLSEQGCGHAKYNYN